jgi:hypothetical protein
MNLARPGPHSLQELPTLTEVIELPPPARDAAHGGLSSDATPVPEQSVQGTTEEATAAPAPNEEQLVERVLTDLQRTAGLMLEYRLREALTPALARLADTLVRDVRIEFAATLRDMVEHAVTQELARQRGR